MSRPRVRQAAGLFVAWVVLAASVAVVLFVDGERTTSVAGHDAVVSPTFDGYATVELGPYVPDLRYPTGERFGARIDLGKTTVRSYEELISRYALIGAQPEGEIAKVAGAMQELASESAVTGGVVGLSGPLLWLLVGPRRRAELAERLTAPRLVALAVVLALCVAVIWRPWQTDEGTLEATTEWEPLTEELPDIPLPAEARELEVEAGLFTTGTRRIANSLMDSYSRGFAFYEKAAKTAADIAPLLHQPQEGETVALLVSDRHDNIGMDKVARAIADAGGATMLLAAGDDTSTGSRWEAFSIDSLDRVFRDYEHRFAVTGNHDHGEFIGDYLDELGFERFDGEAAEGPDGIRILGADDPRSSGLGSWRDETGLSFSEHAERVADQVCEYHQNGERIATLLVHDANTGRPALERGCVDLVVGGHVHDRLGPTEFVGPDAQVGYSYTNGTTGGAAYAIAIGSKPRRNAMVTLVTYREGRPVGIQPVTVRTVGDFRVGAYEALNPGTPETTSGPTEVESP